MTDTLGTYSIPDQNIDALEAQLAKLNKRAKKLGVAPVTLDRIGHTDTPHACGLLCDMPCFKKGSIKRVWDVVVCGETPKYEGWTFVATIEHIDGDNIVRVVPGAGELPVEYRTVKNTNCDQCRTNRYRRDTYVVRDESGVHKQVGSNCIKDFLGHKNPQALAAWAEYLAGFGDDLAGAGSDGWDLGGGGRDFFDSHTYLTHVAAMVRVNGWLSRTKARDGGGYATADRAIENMFPPKTVGKDKPFVPVKIEAIDEDRATAAIEWAENVLHEIDDADLNDYLHNLRAVTKARAIEQKHVGLFASLLLTAEREGEKAERIEREKTAASSRTFVGTVGKREVFKNLKVVRINAIDGHWGLTTIVNFRDTDDNAIVWFKAGAADFEVDGVYDIKATVKSQESDEKWGPQTVISRAVVVKTHEGGTA